MNASPPVEVTRDKGMTRVTCSAGLASLMGTFQEIFKGVPREDHQWAVKEMIGPCMRAVHKEITTAECVTKVQSISQVHQLTGDAARELGQMITSRVESIYKAMDLNPALDAELMALTARRN
jgi:hypothetical protein